MTTDEMAEATGVKRILDSLREVSDLDTLQMLFSNATSDAMAPWLQRWMIELLGQERDRRETGAEPRYTVVNPLEWPADELTATTVFTIAATECAAATEPQIPTITQFCLTCMKTFTAVLGSRLMLTDPTRCSESE